MAYATIDEVYQLALSARAFVVGALKIDVVDVDTGTIRLQAHGCSSADRLLFSCTSGGALPPELNAFTYYQPIVLGSDLFQIDDGAGSPIIFTADPRGWAVAIDPERRLFLHLEDAAGRINECLTAEAPPIKVDPVTGLYPPVLIGINARMAARSCVASLQLENPIYRVALDRLLALETADNEMLAAWKAGKPIHPTPTDQTPDIADNGARAGYDLASPEWVTGVL